jgi:hypothetical protein
MEDWLGMFCVAIFCYNTDHFFLYFEYFVYVRASADAQLTIMGQ